MELLRGHWLRLRGAQTGARFGVGPRVRVEYPCYLEVGDDVTICEQSYLHCLSEHGVRIGSHTSIDRNLWLHCGGTPDDYEHGYFELGHHSFIGCNAVLGAGGGIRIGNNVLIGQSVNIHAENHNYLDCNRLIREQGVSYAEVVIEDDVWIGSKATILTGVTVGRGTVIGAGAVVTECVPQFSVAVGVPARVVSTRDSAKRSR
jgi:acetyltransferase-like isoleucine patch superfamily enzyme